MIVQPLAIHPLLHVCEHMRPRDQRECLAGGHRDLVEWANDVVGLHGDQFTLCASDGEPVGACGWIDAGDQQRLTWFVSTARIVDLGWALHRFAVRVESALALDGVRWFRTFCLNDQDPTSARWLERLGYLRVPNHDVNKRGTMLAAWEHLED